MTQEPETPSAPSNETPLQGWKEIAAYLERDVRTARRWELDEAMPVRRYRTDRRSSVYAYPSEIETWRSSRPAKPEAVDESTAPPAPVIPPWTWAAVAAVCVLGGFVLFLRSPELGPVAQAGAAGEGVRTTQVYEGGTVGMVSPDGRYLSETDWVNSGDIGIRDFQTGEYRRLSDKGSWGNGYGEADRSIFSPDGKQIAYNWLTNRSGEFRYELRIIEAFADDQPQARTIYFNPEFRYIQPDGWTSDGRLLVQFQRGDWSLGIGFVSIETGKLEALKSPQGHMSGLQLSHDGRWIAYSASAPGDDKNNEVYLLAADGSVEKQATRHRADDFVAGFAPDGNTLLFVSNRNGTYGLWGAGLSTDGEIGAAQILVPDIGSVGPMGVLPDGSFVYQRVMGSVDLYSAELDLKSGRILREPRILPTDHQGRNDGPWLSADGKRLAYFAEPPTFQLDFRRVLRSLMVRDLETGREREAPVQGVRLNPYYGIRWSPEGRRILSTTRDEQDRWGLVEVDVETGQVVHLRGSADPVSLPIGWLADGRTVLWRSASEATDGTVSEKTIESFQPGQTQSKRLYASAQGVFQPVISPARNQIAWREFSSDAEVIKLMPVAGGDARVVFQPGDGMWVRSIAWSPDGKSLVLAQNPKGQLGGGSIWIVPLDGQPAFRSELTGRHLANLSVHPDGKTVFFQAGSKEVRIFKTENYLPPSTGATE